MTQAVNTWLRALVPLALLLATATAAFLAIFKSINWMGGTPPTSLLSPALFDWAQILALAASLLLFPSALLCAVVLRFGRIFALPALLIVAGLLSLYASIGKLPSALPLALVGVSTAYLASSFWPSRPGWLYPRDFSRR